jgi:hypothetical protein
MFTERFMKNLVVFCGIYNASAVVVFLTPGGLEAFGVTDPNTEFWPWLSGLLGLFAGYVLVMASRDLKTYGSFPYMNGLIRLIFVVASLVLDFGTTAGTFIGLLAFGDFFLGMGCVIGLPRFLGRTHWQMLTNDRSDATG